MASIDERAARAAKIASVLRPLGNGVLSRQQAERAAQLLGVHCTTVYRLRRRFLADPVVSTLEPRQPGRATGADWTPPSNASSMRPCTNGSRISDTLRILQLILCLSVLNDADVTASRWKREWLDPSADYDRVHHSLLETVPQSIFARAPNLDAALRAISRYRCPPLRLSKTLR